MNLISAFRRINYRHFLPDLVIVAGAFYLALFIRLGADGFATYAPLMNRYVGIFVLIRLATFAFLGVYDIIWRYVSVSDALKLVRAVGFSTVIIIAATYLIDMGRMPRSTFFIEALLSTLLLGGIRVSRRVAFEKGSAARRNQGRLTLIYGAGINARTLASLFGTDAQTRLNVLGFIDDDPGKIGRFVAGIKVLGSHDDLAAILKSYPFQELIIASSTVSGTRLREVVQTAMSHGLRPRMLTDMGRARNDQKTFDVVRGIELSDLLNRPQSQVDLTSLRKLIENRRVLITGAGGSIGSEIARQVSRLSPSRLLLLDHSEFNLYEIDKELRPSAAGGSTEGASVEPLLVDVKDRVLLERVLREGAPEIVFHAAAYKHVHLVENNACSAILNNIQGTKNLLELCEELDVHHFVQISTDKAVNPVGIMGATKRVCELLVTEAAARTGHVYCSVRFGNVLGSSGSLIPNLQKQIQNNEPVTVTHQDMTRYFMLIPEAVSLVLKAATIAKPGDISILRMGEPVRIVDVARSLIALMGKSENECPIVFTGLRPGEKMFEELYLCGNELNTEHPDILILPRGDTAGIEHGLDGSALLKRVEGILAQAQQGDRDCLRELRSLIQSPDSQAQERAQQEAPRATFH